MNAKQFIQKQIDNMNRWSKDETQAARYLGTRLLYECALPFIMPDVELSEELQDAVDKWADAVGCSCKTVLLGIEIYGLQLASTINSCYRPK